jgi:hypothetical protein
LLAQINLKRGAHKIPTAETCLAGAGTLQMEFTALSMVSGDPKYAVRALCLPSSKKAQCRAQLTHVELASDL